MDNPLRRRLFRSYWVLELIETRREQAGDDRIGAAVEKRILDRELEDLEQATEAEGLNA